MSQVTVEALRDVRNVYAHAHCPDGLSSAMIVTAAYASVGLSPNVDFVTYDTADHSNMTPAPHQLFVDITPPLARWQEWQGFSPVVLDHHDTAQPATLGLGGVYGGLDDSAASLAFKHVMRPLLGQDVKDRVTVLEKWAKFAFLCMLRDTWKEDHAEWKDACATAEALNFYTPKAMLVSAAQVDLDLEEILRFGRILHRKTEYKVVQAAKGALFDEYKGKKFGYFNVTEKIVSETCHELLKVHGCDVAVSFFFKIESGRLDLCVSLRSHKQGVPVNRMAEFHGGGGHQPAAGFRVKGALDCSVSGLVDRVRQAYDQVAGT